ncbi:MAG: HEAT repeat domain-containing protein, partial [Vicinamibacterales bacterium]
LEGRLLAVLAPGRVRAPARATRWAVAVTLGVVTIASLGATPASLSVGTKDATPAAAPAAKPRAAGGFGQDAPTPTERLAARRAVRQATEALESSQDAQARERAVIELTASGQSSTIRPLEAALADPDQDVREKAALGLALLSSPDAIPGLLLALSDPDAQVREKAAIGLALRRDARVFEALVAAMDDPDAQVREKAAIALGTSGDARAAAALERALQDPDAQVREKAVTGMLLLRGIAVDSTRGDQAREGLRSLLGAFIAFTK